MRIQPIRAGLFGRPLSGSLSPDIFSVFSRLIGTWIIYTPREVEAGKLKVAIEEARAEGWNGFNITTPYKSEACSSLDLSDPAVSACGAVNAVRFGRAGLEGMNTDARALIQALGEAGFEAAGGKASIFGAGGSAASAGWALGRSRAAGVTFHARDISAARRLADRLGGTFPLTEFSAAPFEPPSAAPQILINATPLGMYAPGRPPCEPAGGTLCADLAYSATGTEFASAARAAGATVIDGISLLVRQAALSLHFWAGLPSGDIVKFSGEAERLLREKLQGGS